MSSSRKELLVRLTELWNAGDIDDFLDELGPDFVFSPDPSFPDAGDYRGEDSRRWLHEWADAWDESHIEVDDWVDHGSALTARARWHVRATGSDAELPLEDFTFICEFDQADRPISLRAFFDHERAMAAVRALS